MTLADRESPVRLAYVARSDASKTRLRTLAQTSFSPSEGSSTPSLHSSSGISVQSLRDMIRRVERELESEMIDTIESTSASTNHPPESVSGQGSVKTKLLLTDSQLRMALWLNKLPLKKSVTWYPDEGNAHALSIVRSVL